VSNVKNKITKQIRKHIDNGNLQYAFTELELSNRLAELDHNDKNLMKQVLAEIKNELYVAIEQHTEDV